jgi:GntR family negative regulator for fad regulon and positive regulator of fabA
MAEKEKASDRAERMLIERIIDGTYPPGSDLPGERDLCRGLGVARPALREALQRLSRDGWLDIQQGKPTHVHNFMRDGNLNILISLLQVDITLLPGLVPNLLEMWGLLAPTYTHHAVTADPKAVYTLLYGFRGLADRPLPIVRAQWRLHRALIDLGDNPVYGLILNSFRDFYTRLATYYFRDPAARDETRAFWDALYRVALSEDADAAAGAMRAHMQTVCTRWSSIDIRAMLTVPWEEDEPEE